MPLVYGDGWAVFFFVGLGKTERESECRPHSDRVRGKTQKGVRMQATFGLGKGENPKGSPNAGLIRTAHGQKTERESEYRRHSDSTRPKNRKGVRMQATFGLAKNKKSKVDPNGLG